VASALKNHPGLLGINETGILDKNRNLPKMWGRLRVIACIGDPDITAMPSDRQVSGGYSSYVYRQSH